MANNYFISGAGFITGIVDDFVSLPTPASSYDDKFYIVRNGSGGLLTWLSVYKYPAGLYSPNASNVWELTPFNVKLSEDSLTLLNISNWSEFYGYAFDITIGDRIIYNGSEYKNKTGSQTSTAPNLDTTNWENTSLENIINVAKSGGDYTSIKDAVDSTDGITKTSILVSPGIYSENNPIQGKSQVTIKSNGGQNTVEIVAQNPNQNLFNAVSTFFIEDVTLKDVSGAGKYAVEILGVGAVLLSNILFENCSNCVHLNNAGGQLTLRDGALISTVGNPTTYGVYVEAGNLLNTFFSIVGMSYVNTIFYVTGVNSFVTLNNLVSFSPNVTTGIFLDGGCRVSGSGSRLVGIYDGLVIQGNDTQVRIDVLQIFNAQNDGFRINNVGTGIELALFSTTISGCVNLNFNILNVNSITSGNGFTELEKSFIVTGAQIYAYLLDTVENDEGLNILGELHVGRSMFPAESVFGAGDSHTYEYVYTFDGVSTYTDKTAIAKSASSSTFTFDGVTAGNMIYIANRYPLTFEGIKIAIETAITIGAGEIIAEYWNGSSWTEFNGCTVQSSPGFLKYAKNYFSQTGSYHIKYNPYIRDDWTVNDPMTLGINYYWIRYRIETAITTSPAIQQIKIHTNRTELNTDGTQESHMDARVYKKLSVDAVRPLEGNMQNGSLYVDENVGVGLENNRFTTVGDLLGISFELPEDCDTSAPIIFVWKGKFASTGNVDFTVRMNIVKPGDAYTNTEPASSGETLTVSTGTIAIANADTREDFRVDLDISNAIPSRENGFGDEIWITLQYVTRGGGNFDYSKLSANYLSDFAGRHIRQ